MSLSKIELFYESETGLSAKRGAGRIEKLIEFMNGDSIDDYEIILKEGVWYNLLDKYTDRENCRILGSTTLSANKKTAQYCIAVRKE